MKRVWVPLISWIDKNFSNIRDIDHIQYGREIFGRALMPTCTANEAAPEDLIALVSSNCSDVTDTRPEREEETENLSENKPREFDRAYGLL